jgi:hypothetical protein
MTSDSESNALANHNGRMIEEIVRTLLPELQYVGKNLDAEYHGRPLEIKSCQTTCQASDRGKRPGRFWFRADQDKTLKDADGFYALVVHDNGNLHFFILAEARRLLNDFSGAMTVSWRTIARRVL